MVYYVYRVEREAQVPNHPSIWKEVFILAVKVKVVDPKVTRKAEVSAIVREAFESRGIEVLDGADFGFTAGTLVLRFPEFDVQLKPITPKAGVERYTPQE